MKFEELLNDIKEMHNEMMTDKKKMMFAAEMAFKFADEKEKEEVKFVIDIFRKEIKTHEEIIMMVSKRLNFGGENDANDYPCA